MGILLFDVNNGATHLLERSHIYGSSPGGAKVARSPSPTHQHPSAYFSGIIAGQTLSRSSDLKVTWTGGNPNLQNAR